MNCTSCKKGKLRPDYLDDLFPCHTCDHCGGNWIYIRDYLRWVENSTEHHKIADDARVVAVDTKKAMLCPKTGVLMRKYKISKNTSHQLDLSPEISAIWLDKGEWALLKKEGFATKLNVIFTDPWQRKIREAKAKQTFEAMYVEEFGEQGYDKIKQIRDWIYTQPKKTSYLSYLLAEDPYSASK